MKYEVNSEIKVYTMPSVMSITYISSFYVYIQGLSWWLKIFNSIDINTLKAAQSNESIKSPHPMQVLIGQDKEWVYQYQDNMSERDIRS